MRSNEFSSNISCVAELLMTSIFFKCSLSWRASNCWSDVAASELRRTPTVSQICSQCRSLNAGLPSVRMSGKTLLKSLSFVSTWLNKWRTSETSGNCSSTVDKLCAKFSVSLTIVSGLNEPNRLSSQFCCWVKNEDDISKKFKNGFKRSLT